MASTPEQRRRWLATYYRRRDKAIIRMREWRLENLDSERAKERADYAAKREARIAKSKHWNQANAQLRAAREADRRAMIAGAFVEAVHPLVVLELADGVCGICGKDVDVREYQVDHIEPVSLGGEHSYSNTQPAHPRCNISKGNRAA